MFEFRVLHSIRESLSANTDAFQYTVASELSQYKACVHDAGLFHFVRNDTTNEVRFGVSQVRHQLVQLFFVQCRDRLEATTLLLSLLATCKARCDLNGCVSDLQQKRREGKLVVDEGPPNVKNKLLMGRHSE